MNDKELRRILGPTRRELKGQEYEEMRLILALLEPTGEGLSFHCWSQTYNYNGKVFEVINDLTHPPTPPIIDELDWEDFSDK